MSDWVIGEGLELSLFVSDWVIGGGLELSLFVSDWVIGEGLELSVCCLCLTGLLVRTRTVFVCV